MRFADVLESATATVAERKKRTITKQAIEMGGGDIFMARKISALRIGKKFVTVIHDRSRRLRLMLAHDSNLPVLKIYDAHNPLFLGSCRSQRSAANRKIHLLLAGFPT